MFSRAVGLIILFFLLTSSVDAAVVINEFLPNPSGPSSEDTEWIELYNTGPDAVDLSGWQLDDIDGGSSPYLIASGSSIPANAFLVFEKSMTNIALNNSDDTVRLFNAQGSLVDSHGYGGTSEDVSIGRTSNGGGSWVTCTSPTKGSGNNCSNPTSTPTNTPTKTPTQPPAATNTPTPMPASSPTPTKSIAISKTPTPKKSPTPAKAASVSAEPSVAVLGMETASEATEATKSARPLMPLILALLFVALGLGILAGVLVWKKRSEKASA